jgi:WD40 repeat protein
LTGATDGEVALWDLSSGQLLQKYIGQRTSAESVDISPDSNRVVVGDGDGVAQIYDRRSGAVLFTLTGHTGTISDLHISPDGAALVTASWDGTARLWAMSDGANTRIFSGHNGLVLGAAFAPSGQTLLTASYDGTVRSWDIQQTQQPFRTIAASGMAIVPAPDGRSFAISGPRDTQIWSFPDGTLISTIPYAAVALAYSSDGSFIALAGADGVVRRWDVARGTERSLGAYSAVNSVAISLDGHRLLVGGLPDNSGRLIDLVTGLELTKLEGHQKVVSTVAFAMDSSYLVTGSDDGTARIWSSDGAQLIGTLVGHTDRLWWLAITPDSKTIVTGSFDQSIRVWDVRTMRETRRINGHTGAVVAVTISPNGRYILTGSLDKTVRLWDLETGQELRRYVGHTSAIGLGGAVAFTPDGRQVLTVGETVRLWDVELNDTIAALCTRLPRDFTPEERAQYGIPNDGPTCPARP